MKILNTCQAKSPGFYVPVKFIFIIIIYNNMHIFIYYYMIFNYNYLNNIIKQSQLKYIIYNYNN